MAKSESQGQPFWLGGAAGAMAACCTHPLDQTKYSQVETVRVSFPDQFSHQNLTPTGIPSLWWGISASILRQSTYSTARFGLYNYFAREARQWTGQQRLSSPMEIACAGAAGGLAGLIGNPTEVALVRMCADGAKSPAQRFGYAHAFDALLKIGRDEGVRTFARGLGPNVVRSVIMNVSQIATRKLTQGVECWTPAWLRLAPNTVLTFIFLEQLQKLVDLSRGMSSAEPLPVAASSQKA
ncbi:hypothetical protein H2202_010287 [Exophiala xenobiotica]|nr:hypothetical protein H2202_010287 [Exophiala xenobiotica]